MQEAAKKLSTKPSIPIIFAFNIIRGYYKEFGLRHYLPLQAGFQRLGYQMHLFPIVTQQYDSTIESRAAYIKKYLPQVLEKLGADQCHILSYSVSGLDFRHYISNLEGHKSVNSLATVSCPHRGSFLADSYNEKTIFDDDIEPITRLIGIPQKSFRELCTSNIDGFNASVHNHDNVEYYSFSAMRDAKASLDMFKHSNSFIRINKEAHFSTENDGVFTSDETVWGNHVLRLVGDHAELVGLRIGMNPESVYRHAFEKLKYTKIEDEI